MLGADASLEFQEFLARMKRIVDEGSRSIPARAESRSLAALVMTIF